MATDSLHPTRRQVLQGSSALAVAHALGLIGLPDAAQAQSAPTAAARPTWHNWSGLQQATPAAIATPANEAELIDLMRKARSEVRAVGSGHSFTALVPTTGTIISLDRLSGVISVDKA